MNGKELHTEIHLDKVGSLQVPIHETRQQFPNPYHDLKCYQQAEPVKIYDQQVLSNLPFPTIIIQQGIAAQANCERCNNSKGETCKTVPNPNTSIKSVKRESKRVPNTRMKLLLKLLLPLFTLGIIFYAIGFMVTFF